MATSGAQVPENIGTPTLGSSRSSGRQGSNRANTKSSYRKRDDTDFIQHEVEHLENLKKNSVLQKLQVSRLFNEPTEQLKNWLYFFDKAAMYGEELQQGLVSLWGTFILLEGLLAGVSTQPFITIQDLQGWKHTWYGLMWMLSLLIDFFAMATTALFLGYLLANPGKLSWIWLCKIGALRGIPAILVLLATFMNLVAMGFSTFVLYGWKVGVVCVVFEVIIVAACTWFATVLSAASTQVIDSELKKPKSEM